MTHIRSQKRNICFSCLVFVCVLGTFAACTPKIQLAYVEDDVQDIQPSTVNTEPQNIRYFFDGTQSMEGFTKPRESEYTRVVDILWSVGGSVWGTNVPTKLYRFLGPIFERPFTDVQKDIAKTRLFYTGSADSRFDRSGGIPANSEQPFGSVVDYIKSMYVAENSLNIVITDLYEQNAADHYFSNLFQSAFEEGKSGAMFAVKSMFQGDIYNITSGNRKENILGMNGYSTFFIMVVGNSNNVIEYSERLANEFTTKKIEFKNSLFVVGAPTAKEKKYVWTPKTPKMAGNERLFNSETSKYSMVNIRPTKLWTWGEDKKTHTASADAYIVMTDVATRYIGGIPIENVDVFEFDYIPEVSVEYFDGTEKPAMGKFSPFVADNRPLGSILTSSVVSGNRIPAELTSELQKDRGVEPDTDYIYLIVETKNEHLSRGYYKVQYTIRPTAKVPAWIEERSAFTIEELKESVQPGEYVRVLNLNSVYSEIGIAFNKVNDRTVCSGVFYMVKSK